MNRGRGVDLEIVERTNGDALNPLNVIVPNYVSINGLPVLVPSDSEIDIVAGDNGAVVARLSLFVGRLRVCAEREPVADDPADLPIWCAAFEAVYGFAG